MPVKALVFMLHCPKNRTLISVLRFIELEYSFKPTARKSSSNILRTESGINLQSDVMVSYWNVFVFCICHLCLCPCHGSCCWNLSTSTLCHLKLTLPACHLFWSGNHFLREQTPTHTALCKRKMRLLERKKPNFPLKSNAPWLSFLFFFINLIIRKVHFLPSLSHCFRFLDNGRKKL